MMMIFFLVSGEEQKKHDLPLEDDQSWPSPTYHEPSASPPLTKLGWLQYSPTEVAKGPGCSGHVVFNLLRAGWVIPG
jgi:hypothetical protein